MKYKDNKNKRGFTLIELIAVLVILAIIALIVTPLVMSIVKKAKDSANKRSVDAYGKAVELAVATHLLDTGDYPTSLDNLKVEYTGNEVICNVKKLNEDGSIYLSECSVKGTEVKDSSTEDGWYHYGKFSAAAYQSYSVGDVITYNGMDFYVIENSDENNDSVTMLKAEPLTVEEVNTYGAGHINRYTYDSVGTTSNYNGNGYGAMVYYTSETCGYVNSSWVYDGCTTDYESSEVKYVVDAWTIDKINTSDLTEDSIGYKTRLLTFEDLTNNLGYEKKNEGTIYPSSNGDTPSWVYNIKYGYWTMSAHDSVASTVRFVYIFGDISSNKVYETEGHVVRPVITLKKTAI